MSPEFHKVPYAGEEPLGIIAINVGVLTSGVEAWVLYPGKRPFYFEAEKATYTSVDGVKKGFLLHFYPPETTLELDGFKRPMMPQGVSPELALTIFLSSLRNRFDTSLQDVALWGIVKDRAPVVFTHPSAWNDKLDRIQGCIRDAGWLDHGRKLIFKSEEEALVALRFSFELVEHKSFCKDAVVVTESGPSAVIISQLKRNIERPWIVDKRWMSEARKAGFAVAYNAERAPRTGISQYYNGEYRLFHTRQKLAERGGARMEDDLDIYENKANELRLRSIASLADRLPYHLTQGEDGRRGAWNNFGNVFVYFGGNYITSDEVQDLVARQLQLPPRRGLPRGMQLEKFCDYSGPSSSYRRENTMYIYYNYGAILSYVLDNNLWTAQTEFLGSRYQTQSNKSAEFGDYLCNQYTIDGEPLDLSSPVSWILEADLEPPPSPVVNHIDKIRDSALEFYLQILPWKWTETSATDNMAEYFRLYTSFLHDSMAASVSGHSSSTGFEMVYSMLANGIPGKEFQETIHDLKLKAKEALESATKMATSLGLLFQFVKGTHDSSVPNTQTDVALPTSEDSQPASSTPKKKIVLTREDQTALLQTIDLWQVHVKEIIKWWILLQSPLVRLEERANGLSVMAVVKVELSGSDWDVIKESWLGYQQTIKYLLKDVSPSDDMATNLKHIRDSAVECYNQIRPWWYSSSTNDLLYLVVKDMKQCFRSYESFLKSSVTASESGYSASTTCETFYQKIANGDLAGEELQKEAVEILKLTNEALSTAKKMSECFQSVRQAIIKAQALSSAVARGLGQLNVPVDAINLPLFDPDTNRTTMVSHNSETTHSHLLQAVETLELFKDYIGFTIDWWLEADSRLSDVQKKAGNTPSANKMKARLFKTKWVEIKDAYLDYQETVKPLLEN